MSTIYAKTAQGLHEIATRERRLSPRLRSALILVDGKRDQDELSRLIQNPDETLQALLEAQLIAAVASGKPARSSKPAELDEEPAAAAAPGAGLSATDLAALRREAVRALNDLLGPEAESLAMRMERAGDEEQLRAALERAVQYIANARGGGAAATFATRFLKTA